MPLIFSLFQYPCNANSFSVSVFQDGTLIHRVFDDAAPNKPIIQEKQYKLYETTIKKLTKVVKKGYSKVKNYPDTLIGWKTFPKVKIQLLDKEIQIEPLLDTGGKPKRKYNAVFRLFHNDIMLFLENSEPLCFFYSCFLMSDKSKDIDTQVKSIQQNLLSCKDKNIKGCILYHFFKTLYWCNQDVYYPVVDGTPHKKDGAIPFYLAWDNFTKDEFEYRLLPFRDFLNQIIMNKGEAKITYQPTIDLPWSTDAVRDCFFGNKTHR